MKVLAASVCVILNVMLMLMHMPANAMTTEEYQAALKELDAAYSSWKQLRDQDVNRLKRQDEKIALLRRMNDADRLFREAEETLEKASLDVAKDLPKALRPMSDDKLVKLGKKTFDNGVVILNAHSEMLKAMESGGPEFTAKLAAMEQIKKDIESGIGLSEAGMKQQMEAIKKLQSTPTESEFVVEIKELIAKAVLAGQRVRARKEQEERQKKQEEQQRRNEARERRIESIHERHPGPIIGTNPAHHKGGSAGGDRGAGSDSRGGPPVAAPTPTPAPTPPKPTPPTPVPINPYKGDGPYIGPT